MTSEPQVSRTRLLLLLVVVITTAIATATLGELAFESPSPSGFVLYFLGGEFLTTVAILAIFAIYYQTNGTRRTYLLGGIVVLIAVILLNVLALQVGNRLIAWIAFGIWIPYFILAMLETSWENLLKHRRAKPASSQ